MIFNHGVHGGIKNFNLIFSMSSVSSVVNYLYKPTQHKRVPQILYMKNN